MMVAKWDDLGLSHAYIEMLGTMDKRKPGGLLRPGFSVRYVGVSVTGYNLQLIPNIDEWLWQQQITAMQRTNGAGILNHHMVFGGLFSS